MRTAATKVCTGCGGVALGRPTARMLEFVIAFHEKHQRYPTYRDIRIGLAYETNQAVRYHVMTLRENELVTVVGEQITGARRTV